MKNIKKIEISWIILIILTLANVCFSKTFDYTSGNRIKLILDPEESMLKKIELIKNARHHIHIMTYYMAKGEFPLVLARELKKAHDRGVDVRILTTKISNLPKDFKGEVQKILFENNENKNNGVLSYMSLTPDENMGLLNNIHEKIFLIDGKICISGGRNLTDELLISKDLEFSIEGPAVNQIQTHFETMFRFMTNVEMERNCLNFDKKCQKNYTRNNFNNSDEAFFPKQPEFEENIKARVITNNVLIDQYKNRFWGEEVYDRPDDILNAISNINFEKLRMYNYFFIPSKSFSEFLDKNLQEKKSIELVTNSKKSAKALSDFGYFYNLPELYKNMKKGLTVYEWLGNKKPEDKYEYKYIHIKALIFDNDHAILGSHNYNAGSSSVANELVIEFYSNEIVDQLVKKFDEEKNDEFYFLKPDLKFIENEMNDNIRKIRLIHLPWVKNLIRQIY